MRAAAHFGYDPHATYIILTPPVDDRDRPARLLRLPHADDERRRARQPVPLQYAFIPWLNTNWPGVGTGGCGMHNVNATSDAFGNGIFDG